MHQAGIFAAAALHALESVAPKLQWDHANARAISQSKNSNVPVMAYENCSLTFFFVWVLNLEKMFRLLFCLVNIFHSRRRLNILIPKWSLSFAFRIKSYHRFYVFSFIFYYIYMVIVNKVNLKIKRLQTNSFLVIPILSYFLRVCFCVDKEILYLCR